MITLKTIYTMENEKTSKLIPFDLKRALNGSKVVTQHGHEVKIGGYNPNALKIQQLAVWVPEWATFRLIGFNIEGISEPVKGEDYQLYMAETAQEERDRIHDENVKKLVNDFFRPGEFIDPDDSLPWLDRKDAVGRRNGDVLAKTFGEPQQCTEEQFKENVKKMERRATEHNKGFVDYDLNSAPIHPDYLDALWKKATRQPLQFRTNYQYPEQYLADINMTLKEILKQLKTK